METISAVVDTLNPKNKTPDFALYLARLTKSRITGIFLDDTTTGKLVQRDLHGFPIAFADNNVAWNKIATEARTEETFSNFKKACSKSGVYFTIHRDHGI